MQTPHGAEISGPRIFALISSLFDAGEPCVLVHGQDSMADSWCLGETQAKLAVDLTLSVMFVQCECAFPVVRNEVIRVFTPDRIYRVSLDCRYLFDNQPHIYRMNLESYFTRKSELVQTLPHQVVQ